MVRKSGLLRKDLADKFQYYRTVNYIRFVSISRYWQQIKPGYNRKSEAGRIYNAAMH